jgi:predicted deacylase
MPPRFTGRTWFRERAAAAALALACAATAAALSGAAPAAPAASTAAKAAESPSAVWRTLCEGTPSATPCYVVKGAKEGPTVMILGGTHGDEAAGAAAAEEIRHWKILAGRLVIIPRANAVALAAHKRRAPDAAGPILDLNRDYPSDPAQPMKGPVAQAIWAVVEEMRPDWLLDLHEGTGPEGKTVANSIIHCGTPKAAAMAELMRQAVNETVSDPGKRFILRKPGVEGSLAHAAAVRKGVSTMILETAARTYPLAVRVAQHRVMVNRLLKELGMAAQGPEGDTPARKDGAPAQNAIQPAAVPAAASK